MYTAIVKSNHAIASFLEPSRSGRIIIRLIRLDMGVSVNFDQQFGLSAIEIRDELSDDVLAAELVAKLAVAYTLPDFVLGGRKRMAQITSALEDGWVYAVALFFGHFVLQGFEPHPRG